MHGSVVPFYYGTQFRLWNQDRRSRDRRVESLPDLPERNEVWAGSRPAGRCLAGWTGRSR